MKRFILLIIMLFSMTALGFAKQFCVRIDCYEVDNDKWGRPEVGVNVEDKINEYLQKGYKLVSITPRIGSRGYGPCTVCYYCIFDDGKE